MPTDTQITGGTCPMMISEQEYQARPFTDLDYASLDEYVQFAIIKLAIKLGENLSDYERKELQQNAIVAAVGVKWNGDEGGRLFNTPGGLAFFAWVQIKANYSIPFKKFEKQYTIPDNFAANIDETYRVYEKLNFLPKGEDNEDNEDSDSGDTGKN